MEHHVIRIEVALLSSEESTIWSLLYINRGYEKLETKLQALGANIQRIRETPIEKEAEPQLALTSV